MELKLDEPIGNANRKLRGYVAEIARLKREGCTAAQIHRALTAAGVIVGISSVYREVRRLEKKALAERTAAPSPAVTAGATPAVTDAADAKTADNSGKSVTDTFFDAHQYHDPLLDKLGKK